MREAVVVGCGIIGATISAALQAGGLEVLTLDDARPNAGTPPSGGHLKPSWFGGMPREEYLPAMSLLESLWGMTSEEFLVCPSAGLLRTTVHRVDTDRVLQFQRTRAKVLKVEPAGSTPTVVCEGGTERCRLLVVAAGAWGSELLPELQLTTKQGVSFRVVGRLPQPFIKPWAPYKQVVAHQQNPREIWVGDGTAILPSNWTGDRTASCRTRCLTALELPATRPTTAKVGWRAYTSAAHKNEPCLCFQVGPASWVVTGAGKSGTIAAGWAARRIIGALKTKGHSTVR